MERILDQIIIFICCTFFMLSIDLSTERIIAICIAVSISSFLIHFNKFQIRLLLFVIFIILSFFVGSLLFYIPLICYFFMNEPYLYLILLNGIPIYRHCNNIHFIVIIGIIFLFILAYILKIRTDKQISNLAHLIQIRDDLSDYNSNLNIKNKFLQEKQDYEITNATLNERNRIAREIHDNVGHILSRSILQIAALTAISKDEQTKNILQDINSTLTEGMNSIRASIHNIHDESLNLNFKIKELVDNFDFCPVDYTYNIENDFETKTKYAIIFIIKEALTNIIKHSNATKTTISIKELPGFYKIEIGDNGTITSGKTHSGMGTVSIYDRVSSLNGTINIIRDSGYMIYITLPKNKM